MHLPQSVSIAESSSPIEPDAPLLLGFVKGVPETYVLELTPHEERIFAGIHIPMQPALLQGQEALNRESDWIQVELHSENDTWLGLDSQKVSRLASEFSLPSESSARVVRIRVSPLRSNFALAIDPKQIRFMSDEGSPLMALLGLSLRAFLISLVFLLVGLAASARFSYPSALVTACALFVLSLFSGVLSAKVQRDPTGLIGNQGSKRTAAFTVGDLLPETETSPELERFARDNIAPPLSDVLRFNWAMLAFALSGGVACLFLMRDRNFMGDEAES
ncbi:MAG: hypothetical protein KDB07_02645 [Planctomycetes bacterium]|nr:hypothetical protein [Planctomycetota bacterium]